MKRPSIKLNEKGQSIIFVTLSIMVVMLPAAAIAIDTSNLFLKRTQLQNALDAGTMSAMWLMNEGRPEIDAEREATNLIHFNLDRSQFPAEGRSINVNVERVNPGAANSLIKVTATGDVPIQTFFLKLVPGLDPFQHVKSASRTERKPFAISLLVDLSSPRSNKFQQQRDALNAFIDMFTEEVDQLAIISYSNRAQVVLPMAPLDKAAAHQAIQALPFAFNGTYHNLTEALILGREEIENVEDTISEDTQKAITFFIMDIPNATRAIFPIETTDPISGEIGTGNADLYALSLETHDVNGNVTDPAGKASIKFAPLTGAAPACDTMTACLDSFEYFDSKGSNRETPFVGLEPKFPEYGVYFEFFKHAIAESDYAKDEGIALYGVSYRPIVGGGTGGPPPEPFREPYTTIDFCGRVAADPGILEKIADLEAPYPAPSVQPPKSTWPIGYALEEINGENFKNAMVTIARRILLRLYE